MTDQHLKKKNRTQTKIREKESKPPPSPSYQFWNISRQVRWWSCHIPSHTYGSQTSHILGTIPHKRRRTDTQTVIWNVMGEAQEVAMETVLMVNVIEVMILRDAEGVTPALRGNREITALEALMWNNSITGSNINNSKSNGYSNIIIRTNRKKNSSCIIVMRTSIMISVVIIIRTAHTSVTQNKGCNRLKPDTQVIRVTGRTNRRREE